MDRRVRSSRSSDSRRGRTASCFLRAMGSILRTADSRPWLPNAPLTQGYAPAAAPPRAVEYLPPRALSLAPTWLPCRVWASPSSPSVAPPELATATCRALCDNRRSSTGNSMALIYDAQFEEVVDMNNPHDPGLRHLVGDDK